MLENFNYKKKFGQNFIYDENLLKNMVKFGNIDSNSLVVEVGAGAGTLTEQIAKIAKKVVSFEIDADLKPHLEEKFKNQDNICIVFQDAMKISNEKINSFVGGKFSLIANLPYYITTPLIFKFLENENCTSLTIMTQKEVAERIVSSEGTKEYGILSVTIGAVSNAKICKIIPKEAFTPKPQVDSAIIHIEKKQANVQYETLKKLVQASFAMRRKTLQNNLTKSLLLKENFLDICTRLGINPASRAEQLSTQKFIEFANEIDKLKK